MTKAISIFVYDKEVYKIGIKRWRVDCHQDQQGGACGVVGVE